MTNTITPIINPFYPEILNAVLLNGNTNLDVIKEQPFINPSDPKATNCFINMLTLAVQHGQEETANDALVAVQEIFIKDAEGNKTLLKTSVIMGSTTGSSNIELTSDNRIFVRSKQYATTELAQNDESLQVGESYMCNGFHMYKQ